MQLPRPAKSGRPADNSSEQPRTIYRNWHDGFKSHLAGADLAQPCPTARKVPSACRTPTFTSSSFASRSSQGIE
eukprot:3310237-Amphidinium_carterae.1